MSGLFDDISIVVNSEQPAFILSSEPDKNFILIDSAEKDAIIVQIKQTVVGNVDLRGPRGLQGERGDDGIPLDPGDLTLIFDNKII